MHAAPVTGKLWIDLHCKQIASGCRAQLSVLYICPIALLCKHNEVEDMDCAPPCVKQSTSCAGQDFTSRWFTDPTNISTIRTTQIIPAELNAYLFQMENNIARFAEVSY